MHVTNDLLIQFLSKTDLFSDFDQDEITNFLPYMQVITVDTNHTIFEEGSMGDAWYLILHGEVSVTKNMPSGPPHVLAHLDDGDCFGEMSLIDGAPRMATLYALSDSTLVRFPRDMFLRLLTQNDSGAGKLLWSMSSVLCRRQRELTYVLSDLVEVPNPENAREYEMLTQLLRSQVTWN